MRLVVNGRRETSSSRTRLSPSSTWSAAFRKRVSVVWDIHTPPMNAKLTRYPR